MQVISRLYDTRIGAWNVLIEIGLREYIELVKDNIDKNEFQRRRVSSSTTVYSLLKSDLLTGCVIPPVVLALNADAGPDTGAEDLDIDLIQDNANSIVILDGLQRTHTIVDLLDELALTEPVQLIRVEESTLRVEVYIGLNRLGILYRMLTLNTGQTPMSLRQQIEMLYSDYAGSVVNGVELLRESDGRHITQPNQYVFKDVVEGFNAYLNRDESPFDRIGILENVKSLEQLSKENNDAQIFEQYLALLDNLVQRAIFVIGDAELPDPWQDNATTPFGRNASQIFKKSQAMSGLGAAVGILIDRGILSNLDVAADLVKTVATSDPEGFLERLNLSMDWLRNNATKIGNAQRNFFKFYFRDLLNPDSDTYLDLGACAESALRKYRDQNA
jgi:hypothetical protein